MKKVRPKLFGSIRVEIVSENDYTYLIRLADQDYSPAPLQLEIPKSAVTDIHEEVEKDTASICKIEYVQNMVKELNTWADKYIILRTDGKPIKLHEILTWGQIIENINNALTDWLKEHGGQDE